MSICEDLYCYSGEKIKYYSLDKPQEMFSQFPSVQIKQNWNLTDA